MIRSLPSWQEACAAALLQSDEHAVLGQFEYAVTALEGRFADWAEDPGSPEELKAILATIAELDRLLSSASAKQQ